MKRAKASPKSQAIIKEMAERYAPALRRLADRGPAPTCPACNGNDADAPCAYPSGGQPGCLRDARLLVTAALRGAGCQCFRPLIGYWPGIGPRCRLCNVVAARNEAAACSPTSTECPRCHNNVFICDGLFARR